jgi:predicted DNA-binding ribbon-helix-helix protein
MPGKRIQLDDETWVALDLLARDRMMDFQELADEAFRDLLRKHGRPTDLKSALRQSARAAGPAKSESTKPETTKPEATQPEKSKSKSTKVRSQAQKPSRPGSR